MVVSAEGGVTLVNIDQALDRIEEIIKLSFL